MFDSDVKSFVKKLEFTNGKYIFKDIFRDIISLTVYFINAKMLNNKQYAEKFDKIMQNYTIEEQKQLWEILLELMELYNKQKEPNDIMTGIFGELELGNKNTGQFFTPTHISDMIAKIAVDENKIDEDIKKDGYTTLHEPTMGAGGMILAYAKELQLRGYQLSRNLYVEAWDIDVLCVYMTFLQLSMYDIPAKIVCGDTLLMKENFVLYTPAYYNFRQLKEEGKLNVPICDYCGNDIEDEPQRGILNDKLKICSSCYAAEQRIALLKRLMGGDK